MSSSPHTPIAGVCVQLHHACFVYAAAMRPQSHSMRAPVAAGGTRPNAMLVAATAARDGGLRVFDAASAEELTQVQVCSGAL